MSGLPLSTAWACARRPGRRAPLPVHPHQRAAFDERDTPGKGTSTRRRSGRRFENWSWAQARNVYDAEDSSEFRFRRSRGIDVWTPNEIGLLNALDDKLIAASNARLAVAGDYLYVTDGTAIRRTQDITPGAPTWTRARRGARHGTHRDRLGRLQRPHRPCRLGDLQDDPGAAATASHITGTVDHVAYGKGRWIATNDNVIYDVTTQVAGAGPVALPAAFYTHPNTDFAWNSFAEGPEAFYVGGFSGDKSLIYRLTMKEDGTGLNQPVVAGFLPDGEPSSPCRATPASCSSAPPRASASPCPAATPTSPSAPSSRPTRPCAASRARVPTSGSAGPTSRPPTTGSAALPRSLLQRREARPAYAADILNPGPGVITSVVTFQDRRVFTADIGGGFGAVLSEEIGVLEATGRSTPAASTTASPMTSCPCSST